MKQNMELKNENAELIKLLKKSKDLIKEEIGKFKGENQIMKRFLEATWSLTEGKIDEKLREQVRSIIGIRVNTITTNHTEQVSSELHSAEPSSKCKSPKSNESESLRSLKEKLIEKENETTNLEARILDLQNEQRCMTTYFSFMLDRTSRDSLRRSGTIVHEVLPVDSANVGSEADEDENIDSITTRTRKTDNTKKGEEVFPGFIKTMLLKG